MPPSKRVHNVLTDDATWRRFRIAAVTAGMTTGAFLACLMDVYDREETGA